MINKKKYLLIVFCLIVCISIGYAYLSSSLKINGHASIDENSWGVIFTKTEDESVSGDAILTSPAEINADKDEVSFSVNLKHPGDVYTVKIYKKNIGTIDATLDNYTVTGLEGTENYLTLSLVNPTVTNDPLVSSDVDQYGNLMVSKDLDAQQEDYLILTLTFKRDITVNDLLEEPANLDVVVKMNYVQKFN